MRGERAAADRVHICAPFAINAVSPGWSSLAKVVITGLGPVIHVSLSAFGNQKT
jgi:hypothetical protein